MNKLNNPVIVDANDPVLQLSATDYQKLLQERSVAPIAESKPASPRPG